MVYSNPQPEAGALLSSYGEDRDPLYLTQREGRERTFSFLLDRIERFVDRPGVMLDVGCYTGVFMELAAARGWQASGIELSDWAVSIARSTGVGPVHHGTLAEAGIEHGSMDLVCMWDVIEHLSAPGDVIDEVAAILRPGGLLALTTHMIDSVTARLMGSRYPFLMSMHLLHFSRFTMWRLLEDRGFEIITFEGHRRTVMRDYLFDRVWNLFPSSSGILKPLTRFHLVRRIPVHIRGLGLKNVFARRT